VSCDFGHSVWPSYGSRGRDWGLRFWPHGFQLMYCVAPMLINRFGIGLDDSGAGVPDHLRNKQIRHACSIQSAGERVSQVVNPEVSQSSQPSKPSPNSCGYPSTFNRVYAYPGNSHQASGLTWRCKLLRMRPRGEGSHGTNGPSEIGSSDVDTYCVTN
jgi:hypothetical protein